MFLGELHSVSDYFAYALSTRDTQLRGPRPIAEKFSRAVCKPRSVAVLSLTEQLHRTEIQFAHAARPRWAIPQPFRTTRASPDARLPSAP